MAQTLVPLTTTFTPPLDCLATPTYFPEDYSIFLGADPSCLPPGAPPWGEYFSPAYICPSGWTSADGTTIVIGNSVSETRATCCPMLDLIPSQSGVDNYMIPNTYYQYACSAYVTGQFNEIVSNASTSYSSLVVLGTTNYTEIYAPTVQLAWQSTDLHPTATSSPTSSSSLVSSSSPAPPTSSATSAAASSHAASGLSTGAKIAIGVVIPVVVLAVLVLGFFIIRRRKSKRKVPTREIQQEIMQDGPAHPMESMMADDKYGSPRVGYTSVHQGNRDQYDDHSRSSQMGRESWGTRTTELPRYGQPSMEPLR